MGVDFAVALLFDDASETAVTELMRTAVRGGANRYMQDAKIPPHVTLAMFECESAAGAMNIIQVLDANAGEYTAGEIELASIGAFVQGVLYLAPVMNRFLLETNVRTHVQLFNIEGIAAERHYMPFHWAPHVTLATKLTRTELNASFAAVAEQFSPLTAAATRLAFVECNPFRALKTWELQYETE